MQNNKKMNSSLKLSKADLSLIDRAAAKKKGKISKNVGRSPNRFCMYIGFGNSAKLKAPHTCSACTQIQIASANVFLDG